MGYTTSTVHGIEVPDSAEANNVPEDIGKVVTALEAGSLVKRLTGAQIAALTAPQKPAGLVVYNTTTGKLQISNGSSFTDIDATPYAIGTRDSAQSVAGVSETTVTYTAETDPSSMLNTGTGIITLPTAGLWMIAGSVLSSSLSGGTGTQSLSLYHGATTVVKEQLNEMASATALIVAAASDTVKMAVYNDAVGSKNVVNARLSVVRIGPS